MLGCMDVALFIVAFAAIYLLPSLVAWYRRHHQGGAIIVLNLFLGWSLLGWVVALVWALTAVRPHRDGRLLSD